MDAAGEVGEADGVAAGFVGAGDAPPWIDKGAGAFCAMAAELDTKRTARRLERPFMGTSTLFLESAEDYANSYSDTRQFLEQPTR